MEMAHATYEKLRQYGKNMGCKGNGGMSDDDWKVVREFVDVGYNPNIKSGMAAMVALGLSDDQLRRKIEILDLPWRSGNGR
jgi:hypothetical protein